MLARGLTGMPCASPFGSKALPLFPRLKAFVTGSFGGRAFRGVGPTESLPLQGSRHYAEALLFPSCMPASEAGQGS